MRTMTPRSACLLACASFALLLVPGVSPALSGGPLAAQQGRAAPVTGERPQQDPDARIRAALAAAARAEIPTSLLESKVREGEAKRVPPARIATAVEARLDALLQASEVLRGGGLDDVTAADLAVGADALEAGVGEDALLRVSRSAPRERRTVAVAVLGQLVELGFAPQHALDRVNDALARGGEALANLRAEAAASLRVRGRVPPIDIPGPP